MSSLKVEICRIEKIEKHPNADKLEICKLKDLDWSCVIQKDCFKEGDLCLYIPIDSILPKNIEEEIFGINSKIKLEKHRIKTIKLRKIISQGLVVKPETIGILYYKEGEDFTKELGITKYEPPQNLPNVYGTCNKIKKRYINNNFHKYTDIENIKNYSQVFIDGEQVQITEKIHGCLQALTPIYLSDGTKKTIQEIVENKLEVPLWGMNENKELVTTKIINWFDNGVTKEWKKIHFTKCGKGNHFRKLLCTSNHKFYNPILNEYVECSKLKIGDSLYFKRIDKQLSYVQEQVLIGKMLGDGSSYRTKAVSFNHKKEHEEYLNYTLQSLGEMAGNKTTEVLSGYGTLMVRARSIENYSIQELFSDWFINEKKQIPKSIIGKLSPISLAFWYMDDGSLSHHNSQEDRACFATCGFNEESINNLILAFNCLNIKATKYLADNYWRIRLNYEEADKFFVLISPYIPSCMKYKLPEYYRDIQTIILKNKKNVDKHKLIEQKIISIEEASKRDILNRNGNYHKYDIETETHNFIANGIVVHNSSVRIGWVPNEVNTIWKKIKKFFGILEKWEWLVGSRNIQLNSSHNKKDYFYDENVYMKVAMMYNLKNKLLKGEVLYGEIVGHGIQSGYSYGCKEGEIEFYAYDILKGNKWLDPNDFSNLCYLRGIPKVPLLYDGPFSKEVVAKYTKGPSVLHSSQEIREGCVIKANPERLNPYCGRTILKSINNDYLLLKNNSDFH